MRNYDYLNKMKEEVSALEDELDKAEEHNKNINKVKNLKIFTKTTQLFLPYVLAASIATGGFALFSDDVINFINDRSNLQPYEITKIDSAGNKEEETVYGNYSREKNTIYKYSKWEKEDNVYLRNADLYFVPDKNETEIEDLLQKDSQELENILGKPELKMVETKYDVPDEELAKENYIKADIYNPDNESYIIFNNENRSKSRTLMYLMVLGLAEFFPFVYRTFFSKFRFMKSIKIIKAECQPINTDILVKKLEIRRNNYKRMMRG